MKMITPDSNQLRAEHGIIAIISISLFYFFTNEVLNLFYLHWIALAICGYCLFQNKYNPISSPKNPWSIITIMLIQALLICCFFSFSYAVNLFPYQNIPSPTPIGATLSQLNCHFGLLPWPLVACCTVLIKQHCFQNNDVTHFIDTYQTELVTRENRYGIGLTNCAITITTGIIAVNLFFNSVTFSEIFYADHLNFIPSVSKPNLITAAGIALIGLLICQRKQQRKIAYLQPSLLVILLLLATGYFLVHGILHGSSDLLTQPNAIHDPLQHFIPQIKWHNFWLTVSACWWLCWTPVISFYIAKKTAHLSTRSTILAILALPLLLTLLSLTLSPETIQNTIDSHNLLLFSIGLVSFFILLSLLLQRKSLMSSVELTLNPKKQEKFHLPVLFQQHTFIHFFICATLFLLTGIYIIGVSLFLSGMFFIITYSARLLLFIKEFAQRHIRSL